MKLNHIISTKQFLDKNFIEKIFEIADDMEKMDKENNLPNYLRGKIVATLFYEPSTRTRFSFETAILKCGGEVISTESASFFSSVTKGETLEDTIKIIGGYADAIVLRHNESGSAKIAANISKVPIINAGDGAGEHPTQALLDLYTIKKEHKQIDELNIGMVGDLLNGRTIHSLVYLLSLYKKIKLYLISPKLLRFNQEYKEYLEEQGIYFEEIVDLHEIAPKLDVVYMTRVQKERFKNIDDYNEVKDFYVINNEMMSKFKKNAILMHPLPRIGEILPEVDDDPRAVYFKQAKNGLYIRMALLKMLFS
jgi:aspartate carbamoyltransferase catalytic subunit